MLQEFVWGSSFRATHLTRDTEYQFQVVAVDYAGNESPASGTLTVRTDDSADVTPPTTPVILSASGNWDCEINVRFNRSTDDIDPPEALSYEFWTDGVLNARSSEAPAPPESRSTATLASTRLTSSSVRSTPRGTSPRLRQG